LLKDRKMAARLAYSSGALKVTAVLIAPTQSGKSKTIEEIYTAQGHRAPSSEGYLRVGNGKQSTTSHATLLPPLALKYFKFNTWEPRDKQLRNTMESLRVKDSPQKVSLSPKECSTLCEYRSQWKSDVNWQADVQLDNHVTVLQDQGSLSRISLQLMDTPGLDDSFGRDDEHIENILHEMGKPEVGSILAFIFIAKSGSPFSNSFLKSVQRYWEQFPLFRHNWIFLHTAMDPSKLDYDDESCFEQEVEERKKLLIQSLTKTCRDDEGILPNLPHIFVDNVIPDQAKIARDPTLKYGLELKKAARAEAHNHLFLALASSQPVPVQEMSYTKSEHMKHIDDILMQQCCAYRKGLLKTLEVLEHQHTNLMGKYTKSVEEEANFNIEFQSLQTRLDGLDTEELVVVAERTPERPWRLFGNSEVITVVSKFPICHKDITCASEYAYSQVEDLGVEDAGGRYVWKVKISSPPFRGCKAILKAYVTKRDKNKTIINRLISEKAEKQGELQRVQKSQEEMHEAMRSVKKDMDKWKKCIDDCVREEALLKRKDVALTDFTKMKDFYCNANGSDQMLMERYLEAKDLAAAIVHNTPSN